jgi:hypothetical protein
MDLVDRYLQTVAKALPEAQREDIIRELSEDIRHDFSSVELKRPTSPLQRHFFHLPVAIVYSVGRGDADFLVDQIGT